MKKEPQPRNLLKFFRQLDIELEVETRVELQHLSEDKLWSCHFGFGMYLRNRYLRDKTWPLYRIFRELHPFAHKDSISGFLTEAYWLYLNGFDFNETSLKQLLQERHMIWSGGKLPWEDVVIIEPDEGVKRLLGIKV